MQVSKAYFTVVKKKKKNLKTIDDCNCQSKAFQSSSLPKPAAAAVKMAHPPAYDPYYVTAPVYAYSKEQNDIKTLFVSGLPDDVKAREIHNLFRRRLGFESCQLKYTGRGDQVSSLSLSLS